METALPREARKFEGTTSSLMETVLPCEARNFFEGTSEFLKAGTLTPAGSAEKKFCFRAKVKVL